jgi:hypothetical protein
MTPYELFDLRTNYTNSILALVKFWVSTTFALLVASQVAGPEMGYPGIGVASALYIFSTAISVVAIRRFGNVSTDIYIDMQRLVAEDASSSTVLARALPTNSYAVTVNLLVCTGSVLTIAYAFYRAGSL